MYEQRLSVFKQAVRLAYLRAQRGYVEGKTVDFSFSGPAVVVWIPDGLGGRTLLAQDEDPGRLGEKVEQYLKTLP